MPLVELTHPSVSARSGRRQPVFCGVFSRQMRVVQRRRPRSCAGLRGSGCREKDSCLGRSALITNRTSQR